MPTVSSIISLNLISHDTMVGLHVSFLLICITFHLIRTYQFWTLVSHMRHCVRTTQMTKSSSILPLQGTFPFLSFWDISYICSPCSRLNEPQDVLNTCAIAPV